MNDLRMEIKVCEGCGALWLRAADMAALGQGHTAGVYCRACVRTFAQYPTSRVARGRRPARLRIRDRAPKTMQEPAPLKLSTAAAGGAR